MMLILVFIVLVSFGRVNCRLLLFIRLIIGCFGLLSLVLMVVGRL